MTTTASIPFAQVVRPPMNRPRVVTFGILSFAAGSLANAVPAYFILCMLKIPAGTAIRPMIEGAMIVLGSLGGLAVGVPLAILCLITGRRWWFGWVLGLVALALSLSPWFVCGALWDWVVAKQGFIMKP